MAKTTPQTKPLKPQTLAEMEAGRATLARKAAARDEVRKKMAKIEAKQRAEEKAQEKADTKKRAKKKAAENKEPVVMETTIEDFDPSSEPAQEVTPGGNDEPVEGLDDLLNG